MKYLLRVLQYDPDPTRPINSVRVQICRLTGEPIGSFPLSDYDLMTRLGRSPDGDKFAVGQEYEIEVPKGKP